MKPQPPVTRTFMTVGHYEDQPWRSRPPLAGLLLVDPTPHQVKTRVVDGPSGAQAKFSPLPVNGPSWSKVTNSSDPVPGMISAASFGVAPLDSPGRSSGPPVA